MNLSDLSISKPVAAIMVTLALVVFGLISYNRLGIENNPNVEFPFLSVTTIYPGADPATVESEVTEKVEDAVATLAGIKTMTSTSAENISLVFIEYKLEVDVDVAAQDVRDRMAQIQRSLPDGVETPTVEKFDMNASPIMSVAISGDVRPQDLADYIDDTVKPKIESVEGVGNVNISGLRNREIKIRLDSTQMSSFGISAQEIVGAIKMGHLEIPGGRVETGDKEFLVVTTGKLHSMKEFEDLVVGNRNGSLIRLRDVAVVEDSLADQRSIARLNGTSAVGIQVVKKSGANTIDVADGIYKVVDEIRASAPPGLKITIPSDDSLYIRDSFHEVQGHLYGGGLIAIVIVLLFLGSFRTTVIAAISIPTSIITTYIFMAMFGFTLNNVTMLAFTLMVGMLIDDAIVVLENIFRHVEMGKSPMQASKEGTKEIIFAVLATTLTVVAVFVPVAFMSGIIGRFMYQYGITVAVGSMASYYVSITLCPMLAAYFMKRGLDNFVLFTWFDGVFKRLENGYRWLIGAALRRKWLTIGIATASMIVSFFLFGMTSKEFFTEADMSQLNITIEMPLGTSLASLSEFTEGIEKIVDEVPEVDNFYTTLGGGTFGEQNKGSIFIDLVEKSERNRTQWEIEDDLRAKFAPIAGAKVLFGGQEGFGSSYDYQFVLTGNDSDLLEHDVKAFVDLMSTDPMFREVDTSSKEGKPEVRINIDRDRAADLGIDVASVGSTLRLLVSGEDTVATYMEEGRQSDIKVRLADNYRNRPEDLESLVVYTREGDPVEVSNFASVNIGSGTSEIGHMNKLRAITVFANINEGYTVGDASNKLETLFKTNLSPGITQRIGGEAEIMAESFQSMSVSLLLAIMLIYVILAAQFNHFVHPLTIMTSLPLSFVGAFGLLYATNMTVNIFSLIGIIMLMGLVTKNAILVVEFANQLRERGMDRDEAMMTAGPIRLRPVVMTALATIGGMLPVALSIGGGAGVEMRAPMAVAVIGGLAASTLLTLVVVPVVYSLFDQATVWMLKVLRITRQDTLIQSDFPDQVG